MLLDVSLAELAADLNASENLAATGLYRLLIEKGLRGPQGQPWAVLIGDYLFDLTSPHAELLGRLAKIAGQAAAPFLSTLHPRVLNKAFTLSPDAAPAWQALRQLPEAALLGLAVPRFLLRLPYGENTQSIDRFSYEGDVGAAGSGSLPLGQPGASRGAALLGQTFQKQGWACKPGAVLDLDNLPIHVYTQDDEQEVTLAEAWLVRPQTEQLIKQGFMPFLCVRGKAAIQLGQFPVFGRAAKGPAALRVARAMDAARDNAGTAKIRAPAKGQPRAARRAPAQLCAETRRERSGGKGRAGTDSGREYSRGQDDTCPGRASTSGKGHTGADTRRAGGEGSAALGAAESSGS